MSKYLLIAAALVVLAVACNKKEETAAPAEGATVEQTAPATETEATEAPEAMPAEEGTEEAPAAE